MNDVEKILDSSVDLNIFVEMVLSLPYHPKIHINGNIYLTAMSIIGNRTERVYTIYNGKTIIALIKNFNKASDDKEFTAFENQINTIKEFVVSRAYMATMRCLDNYITTMCYKIY